MNPYELFKRTPKSNCGQCGYPACLAFAAAVTKGGEDPGKCPFLDPAALELLSPGGTNLEQLPRQRDLELVEHLKSKIAPLDFAAIAAPLGCKVVGGEEGEELLFSFLGREVRLGKKGVLLDGFEPEDPRDQILLYNYVHFQGGAEPTRRDWIGLESLPNTISKVKTLAVYCEQPLAEIFSLYPPVAVRAAGIALGGEELADTAADLALLVPVLPRVPLCLHFWAEAPEEGFSARTKVLFDRRVLDFLDLETLVFAGERLAERLALLLRAG
ncbi:MAG TPA: DUF3786 domain-containing protein [Desulfurivibrio alkaliphilus]|uniref:DUF3786 domain-containing protein n=1 Tax=Desulfurivibrio alkaliphilus TaxID=427923 RepID=A0A7C2XQP8_9BACT|nr:DUF3786 domain-containing protein [Desulfurivibrio alkaliphilus]